MTFGRYMRSCAGEYLLVVVSAWAVATVAMNAFFLDGLAVMLGWWGRSALALAAVAVLTLALYAATWRRRQLAGGLVMYAALLVALGALALVLSTGEAPFADSEGNYLHLVYVVAGCATGCFALTRTLAGSAAWLAASSLACSVVQAFYQSGEFAMSMVAVVAALALIVHKNFRLGLERAESAQDASHARNFAASALPALAVGAAALLLWFGAIAPLDPGEAKVTLVTDYRRLPIEEMKGTAAEFPVLDYSLTTQNLVDGRRYTTDDLVEDPTSEDTLDARSLLEQRAAQQLGGAGAGDGAGAGEGAGGQSGGATRDAPDPEDDQQQYEGVSWQEKPPYGLLAVLAAALLALAAAGYFAGRRAWRKRRLRSWLALPPRQSAIEIYRFLLGRMGVLGFRRAPGATLAEFAESSARQMDVACHEWGVPFSALTEAYQRCAYGESDPSDDELVSLIAGYLGFWKGARAHLGNFKYFFKSFRL